MYMIIPKFRLTNIFECMQKNKLILHSLGRLNYADELTGIDELRLNLYFRCRII